MSNSGRAAQQIGSYLVQSGVPAGQAADIQQRLYTFARGIVAEALAKSNTFGNYREITADQAKSSTSFQNQFAAPEQPAKKGAKGQAGADGLPGSGNPGPSGAAGAGGQDGEDGEDGRDGTTAILNLGGGTALVPVIRDLRRQIDDLKQRIEELEQQQEAANLCRGDDICNILARQAAQIGQIRTGLTENDQKTQRLARQVREIGFDLSNTVDCP